MKEINVLEYNEYPGLRHTTVSDYSGEDYYHTVLNQAFKEAYQSHQKLLVNLDNVDAYASSFLDEAFGNLVYDFGLEVVKKNIEIISIEEPHWKDMIFNQTFPQWESRRKDKISPKVTTNHAAWYRLNNGNLESRVWESPTQ